MEALALVVGGIYVFGSALLVGILIFIPFYLLGKLCTRVGNDLQEKYGEPEIPR